MNPEQPEEAVILIQWDWYEALREEGGKAWITFKRRGQPGIHAQLRSDGLDAQGRLEIRCTSDEFEIRDIVEDRSFRVKHRDSKASFKVVRPETTFAKIHQKTLSSLDVSPGGLGVSCEGDKIFVWETETGTVRRCLEGHLGDVYTCRLFPSGVVVLSGGADMQLKIWSAEDGSCPRTLVGHTASIADILVVDQGMNIIGASKDGRVLLWSCGKSRVIPPEIKIDGEVTCADIFAASGIQARNGSSRVHDPEDDEDEVGTESKLLIVGADNGLVAVLDLFGRAILRTSQLPSSITCVKFLSRDACVAGCSDGSGVILGVDDLKVRHTFHDADSPVTSLCVTHRRGAASGFFAGKQDGSCIWYDLSSENRVVLSGADIDPIYSIVTDGRFVYTGARDGRIRKYHMASIF